MGLRARLRNAIADVRLRSLSRAHPPQIPVVDSVRLELPVRDAFNGALLPFQDGFLCAYRSYNAKGVRSRVNNRIVYLCLLDSRYRIVPGSNTRLPFNNATDPRLFWFRGQPHLCLTQKLNEDRSNRADHVTEVWRIDADANQRPGLAIENRVVVNSVRDGDRDVMGLEKNWSPFEFGGELHFVRDYLPHEVVRLEDDGQAIVIHRTSHEVPWSPWPAQFRGPAPHVFRGNTPPLRIDPERYLSMIHTRVRSFGSTLYYTGFYTFAASPPFSVREVSPPVLRPWDLREPPPGGNYVAFPLSLHVVGKTLVVAGGEADLHQRLWTLNLSDVLANLEEVTPGVDEY